MSLLIASEPPARWDQFCAERRSLFNSTAWHKVLYAGLGVQQFYLSNADSSPLTSVSVFAAGPFRVGYVAFPVGRTFLGQLSLSERLSGELAAGLRELPVDTLRITVGAFEPGIRIMPLPSLASPETGILDLKSWSEEHLPSAVKRNIRRALREGVTLEDATPADASRIWELYRSTIEQHAGLLRYNSSYFESMLSLAQITAGLRVRIAKHLGLTIAYFVTVIEGDEAIYLHGGLDRTMSSLRPTDLLYRDAIEWARDLGCMRLSFLSSPADQPELVRFKEKWGGETREQLVYSLNVRPFRAAAFDFALGAYQKLRKVLR